MQLIVGMLSELVPFPGFSISCRMGSPQSCGILDVGWFFLAHFQADQLLIVLDNYFIKDTQLLHHWSCQDYQKYNYSYCSSLTLPSSFPFWVFLQFLRIFFLSRVFWTKSSSTYTNMSCFSKAWFQVFVLSLLHFPCSLSQYFFHSIPLLSL